MRLQLLVLILGTALVRTTFAQTSDFTRLTSRHIALTTTAASPTPNSSGSFVLETVGGSLGSLIGVGAVALTSCVGDDLGCSIIRIGAGGIAGAIGATLGTTLAAHYTKSRRSVVGAALGSVVGTGVGLGVHYAFNRNSDRNLDNAVVVPIFVISQGTFAAIGSRLLGR